MLRKKLISLPKEAESLFSICKSPSKLDEPSPELLDNIDSDNSENSDNETNNIYYDEFAKKFEEDKKLEDLVFGADDNIDSDIEIEAPCSKKKKIEAIVKKSAKWFDSDDINLEMNKLQRPPTPLWAQKSKHRNKIKYKVIQDLEDGDKSEESSTSFDELDVIWGTGSILTPSKTLPAYHLKILRCPNLNSECQTKGIIRSLEFLKKAQVALVSGADSKLHLFQVDTKLNRKIQTIAVDKFPIFCSHFSCDGEEVIMGSRVPSFHSYNMIAGKIIRYAIKGLDYVSNTKSFIISPDGQYIALIGKFGYIYLLSAKTKEVLSTLKVESEQIESIVFSHDSSKLLSHTSIGIINVWDVSSRKRISYFEDEGCTRGLTLAIAPHDRFIAAGSYSGVVNIYDRDCIYSTKKHIKPIKSVMNLTYPCTNLNFNPTSEILAMSSSFNENAVKLVHLPTMSVFSNFPALTENMSTPYSMDFSPNSGFFAIGTSTGRALLYRLKHFTNY